MELSNIILLLFMHSIAFGVVCYYIGAQRQIGAIGGGILGLLLGLIGLIFVLLSSRKEEFRLTDDLQRYDTLFEDGVITENEYQHLKSWLFEKR